MDSISVSAFVEILNETLTFAYPEVAIRGEVSGYKTSQGKWAFFDIKDENASLSCFLPLSRQPVPIEDGMIVNAIGSPRLRSNGRFSFTVKNLELGGEGELRRAYELLKAKLEAEGLFDLARKRALPQFPGRIGVVTSKGSAAYHDFIEILQQRWGGLELVLADVLVQGIQAPEAVVAALNHLNQLPRPLDVIVLIRGGGSPEDLAAFSTEPVVRAVAASRSPIIVGVGHEIDISLSDLAADRRAATPTDAARLVVPDKREVLANVKHLVQGSLVRLRRQFSDSSHQIDRARLVLTNFTRAPYQLIERSGLQLRRGLARLERQLRDEQRLLTSSAAQITRGMRQGLAAQRQTIISLRRLLAGFDPQATLGRGYAIVRKGGQILHQASAANPGDPVMIQLAQGSLSAHVDQGSE